VIPGDRSRTPRRSTTPCSISSTSTSTSRRAFSR
jgi:hypothetical protein